jgi:hypothetical protein
MLLIDTESEPAQNQPVELTLDVSAEIVSQIVAERTLLVPNTVVFY